MNPLLLKLVGGFIIVTAIAGSAGFAGYKKGIQDAPQVECPKIPKCPDCNCPETINFDKIKGFKGTINLHNDYAIDIKGDSLLIDKIQEAVKIELLKLKVVKCRQ